MTLTYTLHWFPFFINGFNLIRFKFSESDLTLLWVVLCLILGFAGMQLKGVIAPLPAPVEQNKPQEFAAKNKWILITKCLVTWGYPFPLFHSPVLRHFGVLFLFSLLSLLSSKIPANSRRTGKYCMLSKIVSVFPLLLLPEISFGNKPTVISSRERFLSSFNIVSCTVMGCGVS